MARCLIGALPGCVLVTACMKGVEAVVISDATPDSVTRSVAERILGGGVRHRWRLAASDLYLNDELRPSEWDWLTPPTEVTARALYRRLHPDLTDLERTTGCPVRGMRFPEQGERPVFCVFVARGQAAIAREVQRWTGIRPTPNGAAFPTKCPARPSLVNGSGEAW
ncbi:MAG: hypothetical protein ACR2MN_13445 [Acidimicrobiales bacterium]